MSQRCHWLVNEGVGVPFQVPGETTVSVWPTPSHVPAGEIVGAPTLEGATPMTPVSFEVAVPKPQEFVAVTTTRRV